MYEKSELGNGLRLVTKQMDYVNSASIGIWLGAGGRYESKSLKGIAHVLEHLSFKGTKKYSADQIKETIEGLGGSLNAFTSEEFTCYLTKILSKHLHLAIDILSDMVLRPLLLEKDLVKEKAVIVEEIKMYHDLPQSYVYELLDELLWPAHPLGLNLAGTAESVTRISPEELSVFHDKSYHPGNTVVSICSNLAHSQLLSQVSGIFSAAKRRGNLDFQKAVVRQGAPGVKFFNKDTEQSHLALGFHSFKREHPDKHALGLLHIILGANMSSRLFNEVREKKGLAYEIGTQVKRFYDTGAFIVHAGVDNRKVTLAVSTILRELRRISKSAVSKKEFSRAREYYTGQLLMSLEDTMDHMAWMGEQEIAARKIKDVQEVLAEINKVEIADLLRVAGEIFKNKSLNLALIGPQTDKEKAVISKMVR